MPPLARRNLFRDKIRLGVTLTGVVFAVVLIIVQMGLFIVSDVADFPPHQCGENRVDEIQNRVNKKEVTRRLFSSSPGPGDRGGFGAGRDE